MKRALPAPDVLLGAIRARCLDCCGNSRKAVDGCKIACCPLHPYRSIKTISAAAPQERQISGQMDWFSIDNEHAIGSV